jgi:hypothetical protein
MLDAPFSLGHPCAIVQPTRFMTNLIRNRLWFIPVLALSSNLCLAQLQFSFDFDNTTPIIDMNGVFQVSDQIIGGGDVPVALNFGVGLNHDARGVLRGSGPTIVQIGNDFQAAAYRANGRVSGGGDTDNPVQVFLAVNMQGDGTVAGVNTHFSISVAYRLTFNLETSSLEGSSRGKIALAGIGRSRISSDNISVGLPSGGDGSWTMNVSVVPLSRMVGSTQIILSSGDPSGGRPVNAFVSGHFDPTTISFARMVGTNVDRGSSGIFSFSTSETEGVVLETIQARILGQRVSK